MNNIDKLLDIYWSDPDKLTDEEFAEINDYFNSTNTDTFDSEEYPDGRFAVCVDPAGKNEWSYFDSKEEAEEFFNSAVESAKMEPGFDSEYVVQLWDGEDLIDKFDTYKEAAVTEKDETNLTEKIASREVINGHPLEKFLRWLDSIGADVRTYTKDELEYYMDEYELDMDDDDPAAIKPDSMFNAFLTKTVKSHSGEDTINAELNITNKVIPDDDMTIVDKPVFGIHFDQGPDDDWMTIETLKEVQAWADEMIAKVNEAFDRLK